ncbi:hypothetical protein AB0L70_06845 [Kribbella sp. NPDC051952]|uniref:hypothetical protein n=1 Tax=Kribbella sp. NPDC051952 TaxID=3154851 RepID=UPI0034449AE6
MRATYEDLLRVARRMAVNADRGTYADLADWQAVVGATASHLLWLRCRLSSVGQPARSAGASDNSLGRLARALGAAADLLATQAPGTAAALDDREDLAAARAEIAAIVLIAARLVLRSIRPGSREHGDVLAVTAELELLVQSDVRRTGLGALGAVRAAGPSAPVDEVSLIAQAAARWVREHEAVPPLSLLTRDLRSRTAQLRTVGGYASHIIDHLLAAPAADLDAGQHLGLKVVNAGLRSADDGAMRVTESWRRRVSDLSGHGNSPGEIAFDQLRGSLDSVVRRDGRLLAPTELAPNRRTAAGLVDAVDELVSSADQVARSQQRAVAALVSTGRLFVPRHQAARVEPLYWSRPTGGARPLQALWVRTNIPACFDELAQALAWSVDHLIVASEAARRLAGSSQQPRASLDERVRTPASWSGGDRSRRWVDTAGAWIADPGQDAGELAR